MALDQRLRGIHRLALDVRKTIREDHHRGNVRLGLDGLLDLGEDVAERRLTAKTVKVPENPQAVRLAAERAAIEGSQRRNDPILASESDQRGVVGTGNLGSGVSLGHGLDERLGESLHVGERLLHVGRSRRVGNHDGLARNPPLIGGKLHRGHRSHLLRRKCLCRAASCKNRDQQHESCFDSHVFPPVGSQGPGTFRVFKLCLSRP